MSFVKLSSTCDRALIGAVYLICVCSSASPAPFLPDSSHRSSDGGSPYLMPLRRESVPVRRNGEVVSFKTSYSGQISVGGSENPQEFRVVFDTGSGQVVLPSSRCTTETCMRHQRYNISASKTATHVNVDGSVVRPGELCDEVTIGYGTGEVVGEFAQETVCLGGAHDTPGPCSQVTIVMAVDMTPQPFRSFNFDGIVGLGLASLSLQPSFSYFHAFAGKDAVAGKNQFGFFLTDGQHGESSEIALGGYNAKRIAQSKLDWTPVELPKMGYWQVAIKGLRIGNHTLDVCGDGSCRGVVDTGSSHLGIPGGQYREVFDALTVPSGEVDDCRQVEAPEIEIMLEGFSLVLQPENYMRQLPLAPGINPGSAAGVIDPAFLDSHKVPEVPVNMSEGKKCKPRVMPVNLAAPLGPNFFILGEPVLHRYYTVYDSQSLQIGFGLAKKLSGLSTPIEASDELVMFQVKLKVRVTMRAVTGSLEC